MKRRIGKSILSIVTAVAMALSGIVTSMPVKAETYIAEYAGTQYETFEEAYAAFTTAATDGTITLLADGEIAYSKHTNAAALTITSDEDGPHTLSIAEQSSNAAISQLFDTSSKKLVLDDVIIDGTGLDAVFAEGNYHLEINDQVVMQNFSRQIKKGNRMTINKSSTLKLDNCQSTKDDYLITLYAWAHMMGNLEITNSSAKVAVVGYDWGRDDQAADIRMITSDGNNNCDLYVGTTANRVGLDNTMQFGGNVRITVKDGCPIILGATPTFVNEETDVVTITYGNGGSDYDNGTTVLTGNGYITEENKDKFVITNTDMALALDESGNLVLQKTVDDSVAQFVQLDNTTGTVTDNTGTAGGDDISGAKKAWDGNVATSPDMKYYVIDSETGETTGTAYDGGAGWTMIEYPQAQKIGMIRFMPRTDQVSRSIGCYFEASIDGEHFTKLGMIDRTPSTEDFTSMPVYDDTEYRFIRFYAVPGSYMNIAEIKVYTYDSVSATALTNALDELKTIGSESASDVITSTEAVIASGTAEERIDAYIEVGKTIQALKKDTKYNDFAPLTAWTDTDGELIQAHGGGVMWDPVSEKYYWYGEHRGTDGYIAVGTSVYSSTDLYNWTNEGVALPVFNNPVFTDPEGVVTADTPLYLEESSEEFQTAFAAAKANTEATGTEESPVTYTSYTDRYSFEQYNKHDLDTLNGLYSDLTAEQKQAMYEKLNWNMVLERPKVIYNEKNNNYVMWFHWDDGGYGSADGGVAVSDSPVGPFKFLGTADLTIGKENIVSADQRPNTSKATDHLRDMTLFVDDDGTGYLIHSNENNQTLYIEKLTDDYTAITGEFSRNYVRTNDYYQDAREAPAVFKYNGKYYLVTSGCTGWKENAAAISVADTLIIDYEDETSEDAVQHIGPFQHIGETDLLPNPMMGPNSAVTFYGQSTCMFPVQGKDGCFIFMADKWSAGNLRYSKYIWLPVVIDEENNTLSVLWASTWSVDDFDKIASNRKELSACIQRARTLDTTNYDADTVASLKATITAAEAVALDADETVVANMITELNTVMESAEFSVVEVAKQKADALSKYDYTAASWKVVEDAYQVLDELDQDTATNEDITAAVEAMDTAIGQLVSVTYTETEMNMSAMTATANSTYQSDVAANAIDDNTDTYWHSTATTLSSKQDQAYLTLEMDAEAENDRLVNLKYLPRQDSSDNGVITRYAIKVSSDGLEYTEVENGFWNADKEWKNVTFLMPKGTKYVRLVAQASMNGSTYASAAEVQLYVLSDATPYDSKDINRDGLVNAGDIQYILNVASGNVALEDVTGIDYDGNGTVTSVDALKLYLDIAA